MAKLGHVHKFYPFPPFAERHRVSVFEPSDMEASLISKTQCVHCFDSCVWADDIGVPIPEDDRPGDLRWAPRKQSSITLVLGLQTTRRLSQVIPQISHEHPLTLLTSVFPEVKRCLVYFPPPLEAQVIHDANFRETRCAGNFVMFGGTEQENELRPFEDGFGLLLVNEDWEKLLRALEFGSPFALPASPSFPGLTLIHRK